MTLDASESGQRGASMNRRSESDAALTKGKLWLFSLKDPRSFEGVK